jgi:hypothetical protein
MQVILSFLPEDRSKIQLPKLRSFYYFIIYAMEKVCKNNFMYYNAPLPETFRL